MNITGGTKRNRKSHRHVVMREVLNNGPLSRAHVAISTGLTPAAISKITRELLDASLLCEGKLYGSKGQRGRRHIEIDLLTDTKFVVGITVNSFEQSVCLADLKGKVFARRQVDRISGELPRETVARLAKTALSLIETSADQKHLLGCCIAMAGIVDSNSKIVIASPDIGWLDVPVGDLFREWCDTPVHVESMQNALNIAESCFGGKSGVNSCLLVTVALGIGASLISDGNLVHGANNTAASIGHIRVPESEELCTCGRRGCLSTVASGHAVLTKAGILPYRLTARENTPDDAALLMQALTQDVNENTRVKVALREAGRHLGVALKAVAQMVAPDIIVLTGPVTRSAVYIEAVRKALGANDFDPFGWVGELRVSDASIDEAAARLALDTFVFSDGLELMRMTA